MTTIPTPQAKPTSVRYEMLAWACSLSMLTYIDRVCIKEVARDMRVDLGISEAEFAWVFSAFSLAYASFEIPSGWLGDRFGPRKILSRIVLWWSFFTAMTGVVWKFSVDTGYSIPLPTGLVQWLGLPLPTSESAWTPMPLLINSLLFLMAVRFLFGMGEAGAYPNAARALRSWFPYGRRGLAQGLLWMFGRWGGSASVFMIAPVAFYFGWRGAFITFGVIGALWVVGFYFFFRNTPAEHPRVNEAELAIIQEGGRESQKPPPIAWSHILRSPSLWFLCLMYFCSNAGWCFFITWDVVYYERELGLGQDSLGLKLASGAPLFFGGIACILGGFGTDWQVRFLGRRWGRTLQGFLAYALGATFFFLALLTNDPWIAVPSLCLASFFKDFAMAVSWSTCIDIGHRYSGTIAGFMNMVGNFGQVFAPPIVKAMASRGDWDQALVFSGTMFLVSAVSWLLIDPRRVIVYTADDHARLKGEGTL